MKVATGTWGVGKTTVLEALEAQIVAKPGRALVAANPSLQGDGAAFARAFLYQAENDYTRAPKEAVFDRGVVDALAYARWFDVDPGDFEDSVSDHRYGTEVLFFPFWEEIYVKDALRRAGAGLAADFEPILVSAYEDSGYELIEVPRVEVQERVHFVSDFLSGRL